MSLEPSWVWSELVAFFKDFPETLASPPGVSCPGIADGSHRLRLAGTLDGPRPVPERLYGKAWRVTRRPATFHPVFEAPPRSSILKSPVVVLKSHFPTAFPRDGLSWSLALTAFFYHAGKKSAYEVRCGDWAARWRMQVWGDRPQTIPPDYSGLADPWNVGGLLDIDLCWVTEGFDILVGTSGKPALTERRILLAFEHEDATYADRSGTNLNEILDEVRKIGSVRTNIKVLSFFTSQSEAREGRNIPPIQQEIARFPEAPSLTDTWMILQLSRYEAPRTEFRQIIVDGVPHLSVRGVLLRGDAADPHLLAEEVVRLPGNL